jgi:transcriptional regulator GlxA family with amidase domain
MTQVARMYLGTGGEITAGAMKGMIHRDLGPALTRIHRQPDQPWTVASLAEHANMSRSSFSATFTRQLRKSIAMVLTKGGETRCFPV